MSILKRLFGRASLVPEWVALEGPELEFEADHGDVRVWRTPEGDAIGVYLFDVAPDLPRSEATTAGFVDAYASQVSSSGASLVEAEVIEHRNLPVLRSVVKLPQPQSGMTYLGSYIIPFEACSYVVKVQCEEHGMTGTRESVLLEQGLAAGHVALEGDGVVGEWDPDDQAHDKDFPDHPVSHARRNLARIEAALRVAPELCSIKPFSWPSTVAS